MSIAAAVIVQDVDFVREYVERTPEARTSANNFEPLHYAIHTGSPRSIEVLINCGARPGESQWRQIVQISGEDGVFMQRLQLFHNTT